MTLHQPSLCGPCPRPVNSHNTRVHQPRFCNVCTRLLNATRHRSCPANECFWQTMRGKIWGSAVPPGRITATFTGHTLTYNHFTGSLSVSTVAICKRVCANAPLLVYSIGGKIMENSMSGVWTTQNILVGGSRIGKLGHMSDYRPRRCPSTWQFMAQCYPEHTVSYFQLSRAVELS